MVKKMPESHLSDYGLLLADITMSHCIFRDRKWLKTVPHLTGEHIRVVQSVIPVVQTHCFVIFVVTLYVLTAADAVF